MPAYNAEKTIGMAINSILNQTMKDWELIIVLDGCTDRTAQVAQRFADERIRIQKLEVNHGLVTARNLGNELARADYIAIQDADDLSMPDRLEKSLANIGNADVLIHGAYRNMWDSYWQAIHREYIPAKELDIERLKKEQYLPGWPVFKKSLWQKKRFRTETQYSYDWMMLLDFCFSGTVKLLDVGLYEYVRQENSASQRFENSGKRAESFAEIRQILKKEYKDATCLEYLS